MDTLFALGLRFIVNLLVEVVLGTFFYWSGWPWVKRLTLGRYPRRGWRSGSRESVYVACVGACLWALAMLAKLGQF